MSKLKYINVKDDLFFQYNYNVLNDCFGYNFINPCQEATHTLNDESKVWFPKEAILKNGKYEPGSKEVNWKNIIDDNGQKIIMWLNDGEFVNKNNKEPAPLNISEIVPYHTFMWKKEGYKEGNDKYNYVGTFLCDYKSSSPRRKIFRLIKDSLDLSDYQNGIDFNYVIEKEGQQSFTNFYIEKSFEKHKRVIDNFLKQYEEPTEQMTKIKEFKKRVNYLLNNEDKFKKDFVTDLHNFIIESGYKDIKKSDLLPNDSNLKEYYQTYWDIIHFNPNEKTYTEILKDSCLDKHTTESVFLSLNSFSISNMLEDEVDYFLSKMSMPYVANSLEEKHNLLYFWKQCNNQTMYDWSDFKFYSFLKFVFGVFSEEVQFILDIISPVDKETVSLSEVEETNQIKEIYNGDNISFPDNFEYFLKPKDKEDEVTKTHSKAIKRDVEVKMNALVHADFSCEISNEHKSFISRKTDKPYMETHHLVPLEFSNRFEVSLDVEENVVSLCSNCHNEIHYGKNANNLIKELYEERKELLKKVGIIVSLEELLALYRL